MQTIARRRYSWPGRTAVRGVALVGGLVATAAAAVIGATIAVVFAVSLMVLLFMAGVLIALAAAAIRARRSVRAPADPDLIEARNVGGHSWVAYGWDGQR